MKTRPESDGSAREVELANLDLRYQGLRLQEASAEGRLLASITQRGIEEPLEGVQVETVNVLLNGFKRYRYARRLHLATVPYVSLGNDEVAGILTLLRMSRSRTLSILEQAGFIDELKSVRRLSVAEIAEELSVSKSWVSMRLGLLNEMSPVVREKLFSGAFPVYPYMYALRQFMRMNKVPRQEIEQFVVAVSGKKLSVREIEQLAHGCFRGPASFRQEVFKGNIALPLARLQQVPPDPEGTGRDAVMVPEMAAFAQQHGFEFICHAKGHANRKAGEERSFWTVETNFLPGRTFRNLEDLNQQALKWSTVRMEQRPRTKARIIPAKAFEHERTFLTPLPPLQVL